jgi:hypothetical protein
LFVEVNGCSPQDIGSEAVWQTDDSPRYGGIGRWQYQHGVSAWQSDLTLRPLARG